MSAFNCYVYANTSSVEVRGPANGLEETLDRIVADTEIPCHNVQIMDANPNLSAGSIYDLIDPWRRWIRRNGAEGPGSHILVAEGGGGIAESSGEAWDEPMVCVSSESGITMAQEVLHNFIDSRLDGVRDLGYSRDVEHSLGKVFQGGEVSPMTASYVDDGHAAGGQCGREDRTTSYTQRPTACTKRASEISWQRHSNGGGCDGGGGGGNEAPNADARAGSTTVDPGVDVTFDGSNSSDPDGSIQSYEWAFGDGATASGPRVTHAYGSAGTFDATLTVTDDDGTSASDRVTIQVEDGGGGEEPVVDRLVLVDADANSDIGELTDGVTFDLSQVGTALSIRADTGGGADSVRFDLDGQQGYKLENYEPYCIQGDDNGDYAAWTPSTGDHRLSATAFSGADAGGSAGPSETIEFTVTDGGGGGGDCEESTRASADGTLYNGYDEDEWSYPLQLGTTCEVTVDLEGEGSDFDLYVTVDGRTPTPGDHDARSNDYYTSDESVTVRDPSGELGILVDSYRGSGNYRLTVTETGSN